MRWAKRDDLVVEAESAAESIRQRLGGAVLVTGAVEPHIQALVDMARDAIQAALIAWEAIEEKSDEEAA